MQIRFRKGRYLYAAVALFKSPTEEFGPRNYAALIAIDRDPREVIAITRSSEEDLRYNPGGYVAVYKVKPGEFLRDLKQHRIGDDIDSTKSPVIFIRYRTSEGWTERWFNDKIRNQVDHYFV